MDEQQPKRRKLDNIKNNDDREIIIEYIKTEYSIEQQRNYPHFVFNKIQKLFNDSQHATYKIYCQKLNPTIEDVVSFISCLTDEQIAYTGV